MATPPADTSIMCPIVIGRQLYVEPLERLIANALDGHGQVIAISGEAGIGKTRLVGEIVRRAQAAHVPMQVLRGHCFEPDNTLPYGPLLDLLRAIPSDDLAAWAGTEAGDLAQILPALRTNEIASGAPPPEPEQDKRRLFAALSQLFTRIAAAAPLLIVIEDLHWCDEPSLEFLLHFSRRLPDLRALLVLTYRGDEVQPALRRLLAGLDRERLMVEWPLSPLDQGQVAEMIAAIFDLRAPVRPETLDAIYPLTEGNPFFIEEVLKSLVTSGEIFFVDGAWEHKPIDELHIPRSVQDAVRERMDKLGDEERRVLVLAAITGRRFDFTLLLRLADLEERELLRVIKELIRAQLVVEESADRFAFRHALTQQAIYGQLLARERRALHRTIGETMQSVYAAAIEPHFAGLAHHFYQANAWEQAYYYAQRVGERAQTLHASGAVIEHFTRAIESAEHLGVRPPASVYRSRGQAHESLGAFDSARADYERAFDTATALNDSHSEWQGLIDLGFLWAGRDYERAGAFFRRAADLASSIGDPLLRARSLNRVGNWLVNVGRAQEGIAHHEEALAIFDAEGEVQDRAETLDLLGMANGIYGDTVRAVESYGEAIELLRPLGPSPVLCSSLASRLTYSSNSMNEVSYMTVRTPSELDADRAATSDTARRAGGSPAQAYAAWTGASALSSEGRMGEAIVLALDGLRIAAEIEHAQWITGAEFTLGQAYVMVCAIDSAIDFLSRAFERGQSIGSAWWIGNCGSYLALAHLLAGDLDRARAVIDAASLPAAEALPLAQRRVVWVAGRLDLECDRPADALAKAERLIEIAPGRKRGQCIPLLSHLKGDALFALNRHSEALDALTQAKAAALERRTPQIWEIHRSLGRLHASMRRADDATCEFDAARARVDAIAGTLNADDGLRDGFLRAALATLPKPRLVTANRAAKAAFGGLTAREREVATLIARGKSNREIAAELVLGERTIETHVGNVLSKLEFSSRAQVAAWAVESGLTKM